MLAEVRVLNAEPPCADTVAKLEYALELARSCELSSVGIAMVTRDGSCETIWSEAPSFSCLTGAVARLQYAIMRHAD